MNTVARLGTISLRREAAGKAGANRFLMVTEDLEHSILNKMWTQYL